MSPEPPGVRPPRTPAPASRGGQPDPTGAVPGPRFASAAERAEGSGRPRPAIPPASERPPAGGRGTKRRRRKARKVRRVVRHVDPWSVLKLSILFYFVLFLIISVAVTVLWSAGRQTGAIENVEDFITELGVFGECEDIDGAAPAPPDTTPPDAPVDPDADPGEVDQFPGGPVDDELLPGPTEGVERDDDDCIVGQQQFVGSFRFEGDQLFQAFVLGGLVLVLAGAAANVVLAVLFNLISDLTGGVRVTVLEEEPPEGGSRRARSGPSPARTGSPPGRTGG